MRDDHKARLLTICLGGLLVCLLWLRVAGIDQARAADGPSGQVPVMYYGQDTRRDPSYSVMSRWSTEFKVLTAIPDTGRNVAVGLINVTGMSDDQISALVTDAKLSPSSIETLGVDHEARQVTDEYPMTGDAADERQAFGRLAYQQLGLGATPDVERLLKVSTISIPQDKHSEPRILDYLKRQDVGSKQFGFPYTDRQPCRPCEKQLGSPAQYGVPYDRDVIKNGQRIPRAQVNKDAYYRLSGEYQVAKKSQWMKALVQARDERNQQARRVLQPPDCMNEANVSSGQGIVGLAQPVFAGAPCGQSSTSTPAPGGGLSQALTSPVSTTPGGIDFSSLELRYVGDGGASGLRYAFQAGRSTGVDDQAAGLHVATEASDAFFVWLELPTWKFTVNLNPDEPNRIIDGELGRTDAGRAMLEADLALKKTTARLIHPDTPLGAEYWQQLMPGTNNQICVSMRTWIVPAPATVHQEGDGIEILAAPLSVKTETQYLQHKGVAGAQGCTQQPAYVEQHNEAIYRSLILPELIKAVNQAPEFADLRRVYLSRVAAEWYRQRSAAHRMTYSNLVDRGQVGPWTSRQPWSPQTVYNQYLQSYDNGEFKVTHTTTNGDVVTTETYTYGGVDFSRVPELAIDAAQFAKRWPGLSARVNQSVDRPTLDPGGNAVWLGGTTAPAGAGAPQVPVAVYIIPSVTLAWIGFWVLLAFVGRRRRRRAR